MKAPIDYSRFVAVDDLPKIEFSLNTGLPTSAVQVQLARHLNALVTELWDDRMVVQRQGGAYVYVGLGGVGLMLFTLGDLLMEFERNSNQILRGVFPEWNPLKCYTCALSCAEVASTTEMRTRDKSHRLTFLEGKMGVLALKLACHYRLSRLDHGSSGREHWTDAMVAGKELAHLARDAIANMVSRENELLYGRAGILFALHFANSFDGVGDSLGLKDLIVKIIAQIIENGLNQARDFRKSATDEVFEGSGVAIGFPCMYQWHDKEYLGAAHGYCGIIQALLNVKEYWSLAETNLSVVEGTIRAIVTHIMETIMVEARYASGNVASSLPIDQRVDKLVHWCHGAPGFLLTICTFLSQDRLSMKSKHIFNSALDEMAIMVRERGCLRKLGLCHGLGGNGIALIRAYQTTNNPKYFRRAAQYAMYGYENRERLSHNADRPLSLFEGSAGLCYLIMALLGVRIDRNSWYIIDSYQPTTVTFPGYERVGVEIKTPLLRKDSGVTLGQHSMSVL